MLSADFVIVDLVNSGVSSRPVREGPLTVNHNPSKGKSHSSCCFVFFVDRRSAARRSTK